MKVLCSPAHGALKYVMRGWQEVFESIGCEWQWWHPDKPSFDAFDEIEPDIVLLTNETCTRATMKCLRERPDTHVAIKVGNWGYMDEDLENFHEKIGITKEQYPVEMASDEHKKWVEEFDGVTTKEWFVYCINHQNRTNGTAERWRDIAEVRGIMPAACMFHDKPVDHNPELACDIGFVGGYWPYKAVNLNKYILPLCHPVGEYNIKIFGNSHWPVPQWLGAAKDETVNQLFSSALICPNVSEPHANEFGFEVNERVFKLAAIGAFCITDHIASLEEDVFAEHEMVSATDPEDFKDLIDTFLSNPDMMEKHIKASMETVLWHHTYFQRVGNALCGLGLFDLSDKCKEKHKEMIKERLDV